MAMTKARTDYDKEFDILYLYDPKRKTNVSTELGQSIVVDFDDHGEVDAIEFLNASEILSTLVRHKVTRQSLAELTSASFEARENHGVLVVTFRLSWKGETRESQITLDTWPAPLLATA